MHQGLPVLETVAQSPPNTPCPIRQRIERALDNTPFKFFPDKDGHHFMLLRPEGVVNTSGLLASLNGTVRSRTHVSGTLHLIGDGDTIANLIELYRH